MSLGGPATATITGVLALRGLYLVSYAWLSDLPIHLPQGDLIGKRLNIHGFWMYYEEYLPKMRAALTGGGKSSRLWQIKFVNHHNIQTVPKSKAAIEHSERGGKVLLGFQSPKLGTGHKFVTGKM